MATDDEIIAALLKRKAAGTLRPDESSVEESAVALKPAQIQGAEKRLSFELPSLLSRIYSEVANGGFGDCYGLLGLVGGPVNEIGQDAVLLYLDLRQPDDEDEHWRWQAGLLPICHLGCGMYHCVQCDVADAPVIWFEPNPHESGKPWDDAFFPFCPSLREYLWAWVTGVDLWEKLEER